jgi:acyl carrier protein
MTTLSPHSDIDLHTIIRMVFKTDDVLTTERERIRRNAHLMRAAVLDSIESAEVVLVLEDKESQKKLRSRIIATGIDKVMLERGLSIPIQCIHSIEFPS